MSMLIQISAGGADIVVKASGHFSADVMDDLVFHADYNDGRNKEWSLYTPSLNLGMTLRGDVADLFEVGQAYTLQFVESD